MAILTLPVELLDAVSLHLLPADLAALSKTCSALSPVAHRRLYRHISVFPASPSLAVVRTLSRRPDLALCVRSFSIRIDASEPIFNAFYRLLRRALSTMSQLTSLDLAIDPHASWVLDGLEQDPISYLRLRSFSSSFAFDSHVAAFLQKTPNLLELEVDSLPSPLPSQIPTLPPSSIPHLIQYVGSSRTAHAIIPGRPLDSIHIYDGDVSEDDVVTLARATSRTAILSLTTSALPVPLLSSLARHMPHLAYLRIITTHSFSRPPDVEFYEQVANALAALPDLTAFELSGVHWGSCQKGDDGNKRVWQSQPLSTSFDRDTDLEISSELFLPY